MRTPGTLARPNSGRSGALTLTRLEDRSTFLYLDMCRLEQDDNGTHTIVVSERGVTYTTYLPSATLACLLLGPGTSITAPAVSAFARNGCSIVMVGSGGVRMYSTWSPISGSTALVEAQARASVDPEIRAQTAARMLRMRFPDMPVPDRNSDGTPVSIEQLRGIEGALVKATYQHEARRRRIGNWRRRKNEKDGKGPIDSVNEALNYANTALYGVAQAVVCGLGMSPALGIVHSGNPRAFVLDLADLYKTRVTIPLAFKYYATEQPGKDIMRAIRDEFVLLKLIPNMVDSVHTLFGAAPEQPDDWDLQPLSLWGTGGNLIEAESNRYGRDAGLH